MRYLPWLFCLLIFSGFALSQSQPQLNLMPIPASVQQGSGVLLITQSFSVNLEGTHDPVLEAGVHRF